MAIDSSISSMNVIFLLVLVRHMRHAHMGNSFHSGFFAEMGSSKSPLSRITVRVRKISPQSALISQSSLIMHANYKI